MGEPVEDKKGWRHHTKIALDKKARRRQMRKAETATIRHARKFISKRFHNVIEVRQQILVWLAGLTIVLVALGLQQMWFQRSYSQVGFTEGGTYAEAELGPLTTLNPLYAKTPAEIAASRLVFTSLFSYDQKGAINRDLADSVTISPDGHVYTVTIKEGALWHDGQKLTTKDINFTLDLIKDPAARSSLRTQWQGVSVKVVDDRTIVFTLPAAYAPFLHALTFPILPSHLLADIPAAQLGENSYSLKPVGAGPFAVKLVQNPGASHSIVNLVAFEDYFKGAPKLARFEIHAYQDRPAIINALKAGQVTATSQLTELSDTKTLKAYSVHRYPTDGGVYAFFNTSRPALKDAAVRRALRAGIDLKALRQKTGTEKLPLDLPFTPGQLTEKDLPVAPGYDPQSAGSLLDGAGWKLEGTERKKDGQPLTIGITTLKGTVYQKAAGLIASDWKKLGVKATVTTVDPDNSNQDFTQTVIQPRSYDALVYELSMGADLDVYAFWHSSQVGPRGLNLSMYSNPTSDATLTSARARVEPELRDVKYKAFSRQWLDDAPAVGLFQSSILYISNKQTSNIARGQTLVSAYDRYANVLYWADEKTNVYKTP